MYLGSFNPIKVQKVLCWSPSASTDHMSNIKWNTCQNTQEAMCQNTQEAMCQNTQEAMCQNTVNVTMFSGQKVVDYCLVALHTVAVIHFETED